MAIKFEIQVGASIEQNRYWISFCQEGFHTKKEDVIFVDEDGAKEFCKKLPSFIQSKLLKDGELNMEIWGPDRKST